MITYAQCTTSITAETVLNIFVPSVRKYGIPSRIRSDHGYENIFVALLMNSVRGIRRGSHITGRSVHNQRIERLWRDLHTQVLSIFCDLFYNMENQGQLDVENEIHIFVLQYMFTDVINVRLNEFVNGWNHHRIRTAERNSPRQLWLSGMLNNCNSGHTATNELFHEQSAQLRDRTAIIFGNMQDNVVTAENDDISRFRAVLNLSDEERLELTRLKQEMVDPIDKYLNAVRYLTSTA